MGTCKLSSARAAAAAAAAAALRARTRAALCAARERLRAELVLPLVGLGLSGLGDLHARALQFGALSNQAARHLILLPSAEARHDNEHRCAWQSLRDWQIDPCTMSGRYVL